MKKKILSAVEILLSVITFPLWFVKMFIDVGHLPNQEGEHFKRSHRLCLMKNALLVF